jgi:hypothetical protein
MNFSKIIRGLRQICRMRIRQNDTDLTGSISKMLVSSAIQILAVLQYLISVVLYGYIYDCFLSLSFTFLSFFLFPLGSSARLEPLRPASWSSGQLRRLPRPPEYHEPGQFLQVIKYKVGQQTECIINVGGP